VKHHFLLPSMLLAAALVVGFIVEPWMTLAVICAAYLALIPLSIMQSQRLRVSHSAASSQ
jgi:phosphatidylserine synthase